MSLKKVESDPDLINDRTEQLALKMIEFLEMDRDGLIEDEDKIDSLKPESPQKQNEFKEENSVNNEEKKETEEISLIHGESQNELPSSQIIIQEENENNSSIPDRILQEEEEPKSKFEQTPKSYEKLNCLWSDVKNDNNLEDLKEEDAPRSLRGESIWCCSPPPDPLVPPPLPSRPPPPLPPPDEFEICTGEVLTVVVEPKLSQSCVSTQNTPTHTHTQKEHNIFERIPANNVYIKEVNNAIYGSMQGHPSHGSNAYHRAAEEYALYGQDFLDFPANSRNVLGNMLLKEEDDVDVDVEKKEGTNVNSDSGDGNTLTTTNPVSITMMGYDNNLAGLGCKSKEMIEANNPMVVTTSSTIPTATAQTTTISHLIPRMMDTNTIATTTAATINTMGQSAYATSSAAHLQICNTLQSISSRPGTSNMYLSNKVTTYMATNPVQTASVSLQNVLPVHLGGNLNGGGGSGGGGVGVGISGFIGGQPVPTSTTLLATHTQHYLNAFFKETQILANNCQASITNTLQAVNQMNQSCASLSANLNMNANPSPSLSLNPSPSPSLYERLIYAQIIQQQLLQQSQQQYAAMIAIIQQKQRVSAAAAAVAATMSFTSSGVVNNTSVLPYNTLINNSPGAGGRGDVGVMFMNRQSPIQYFHQMPIDLAPSPHPLTGQINAGGSINDTSPTPTDQFGNGPNNYNSNNNTNNN